MDSALPKSTLQSCPGEINKLHDWYHSEVDVKVEGVKTRFSPRPPATRHWRRRFVPERHHSEVASCKKHAHEGKLPRLSSRLNPSRCGKTGDAMNITKPGLLAASLPPNPDFSILRRIRQDLPFFFFPNDLYHRLVAPQWEDSARNTQVLKAS